MWQFIILGYVPGTTIQIDFNSVALVAAGIVVLYLIKSLIKEHLRFVSLKQEPNFEEISV